MTNEELPNNKELWSLVRAVRLYEEKLTFQKKNVPRHDYVYLLPFFKSTESAIKVQGGTYTKEQLKSIQQGIDDIIQYMNTYGIVPYILDYIPYWHCLTNSHQKDTNAYGPSLSIEDVLLATIALNNHKQRYKRFRIQDNTISSNGHITIDVSKELYRAFVIRLLPKVLRYANEIKTYIDNLPKKES